MDNQRIQIRTNEKGNIRKSDDINIRTLKDIAYTDGHIFIRADTLRDEAMAWVANWKIAQKREEFKGPRWYGWQQNIELFTQFFNLPQSPIKVKK